MNPREYIRDTVECRGERNYSAVAQSLRRDFLLFSAVLFSCLKVAREGKSCVHFKEKPRLRGGRGV